MQYHAVACNTMQYHTIPCSTIQYHVVPCNTVQYHAVQCNTMQYHAISWIINNCWRSVPLPCGQYNGHFYPQTDISSGIFFSFNDTSNSFKMEIPFILKWTLIFFDRNFLIWIFFLWSLFNWDPFASPSLKLAFRINSRRFNLLQNRNWIHIHLKLIKKTWQNTT